MKVIKFIKSRNISFERMETILSWGILNYNCSELHNKLSEEQILYIDNFLEEENKKILKSVSEYDFKKTTIIEVEIADKYKVDENFELPNKIDKTKALIAYFNLVVFMTLNLETNYSETNSYFQRESFRKFENIDFRNFKLTFNLFDTYHKKILNNKHLKNNQFLFNKLVNENLDNYNLYFVISKLYEKSKLPFKAAKLLLRFSKIYKSQIHKYKYENFPPYKKIVDERIEMMNYEKDYSITSSKSVSSIPHPFRN